MVIALENVWNNLWVQPPCSRTSWRRSKPLGEDLLRHRQPHEICAVGGMDSRAGQADRQVSREGFQAQPDDPGGKFVNIRDGSVRWPAVRAALDKVGYNGWMTIEGGGNLALGDRSRRLDAIIAGQ